MISKGGIYCRSYTLVMHDLRKKHAEPFLNLRQLADFGKPDFKEDPNLLIFMSTISMYFYGEPMTVSTSCNKDWSRKTVSLIALSDERDSLHEALENFLNNLMTSSMDKKQLFSMSLFLLHTLHEEMQCPPAIHDRFWKAHNSYSLGNASAVLARIGFLMELRRELILLLRAVAMFPSHHHVGVASPFRSSRQGRSSPTSPLNSGNNSPRGSLVSPTSHNRDSSCFTPTNFADSPLNIEQLDRAANRAASPATFTSSPVTSIEGSSSLHRALQLQLQQKQQQPQQRSMQGGDNGAYSMLEYEYDMLKLMKLCGVEDERGLGCSSSELFDAIASETAANASGSPADARVSAPEGGVPHSVIASGADLEQDSTSEIAQAVQRIEAELGRVGSRGGRLVSKSNDSCDGDGSGECDCIDSIEAYAEAHTNPRCTDNDEDNDDEHIMSSRSADAHGGTVRATDNGKASMRSGKRSRSSFFSTLSLASISTTNSVSIQTGVDRIRRQARLTVYLTKLAEAQAEAEAEARAARALASASDSSSSDSTSATASGAPVVRLGSLALAKTPSPTAVVDTAAIASRLSIHSAQFSRPPLRSGNVIEDSIKADAWSNSAAASSHRASDSVPTVPMASTARQGSRNTPQLPSSPVPTSRGPRVAHQGGLSNHSPFAPLPSDSPASRTADVDCAASPAAGEEPKSKLSPDRKSVRFAVDGSTNSAAVEAVSKVAHRRATPGKYSLATMLEEAKITTEQSNTSSPLNFGSSVQTPAGTSPCAERLMMINTATSENGPSNHSRLPNTALFPATPASTNARLTSRLTLSETNNTGTSKLLVRKQLRGKALKQFIKQIRTSQDPDLASMEALLAARKVTAYENYQNFVVNEAVVQRHAELVQKWLKLVPWKIKSFHFNGIVFFEDERFYASFPTGDGGSIVFTSGNDIKRQLAEINRSVSSLPTAAAYSQGK